MTIRADLAAALRPLLPKAWKLIDNESAVDQGNAIVVRLSQQGFRPLPEAPIGHILVDFVVTITVTGTNPARMEDDLDVGTGELIDAIDHIPGGFIAWRTASKIGNDSTLGYDIELSLTAKS